MARRRKTAEPKVPVKAAQPKSLLRKSTRQRQAAGNKQQQQHKDAKDAATVNGGEQQHIICEKASSSAENSSDTNGKESPPPPPPPPPPSTNSHESYLVVTDTDEKLQQAVCPSNEQQPLQLLLVEETTVYEEMEIESTVVSNSIVDYSQDAAEVREITSSSNSSNSSRTGNEECTNSGGCQAIERGLSVLRMSEIEISQSLSTKQIETGQLVGGDVEPSQLAAEMPECEMNLALDDLKNKSDLYAEKIEQQQHSVDSKVIDKMQDLEDAKLGSSSSENSSDAFKQCEASSKVDTENSGVRRSNRIKHIGLRKQRSRGRGLVVKSSHEQSQPDNRVQSSKEPAATEQCAKLDTVAVCPNLAVPTSIICDSDSNKPVKVKSRWRRSSELEMSNCWSSSPHSNVAAVAVAAPDTAVVLPEEDLSADSLQYSDSRAASLLDDSIPNAVGAKICLPMVPEVDREMEERLSQFEHLKENLYMTERYTNKETKRMVCDCFLTEEEIQRGELGCGDDCLNRLLMIECGARCVVGDRCTNRRFQGCHYAKCQVFRTEKKGFGLRATCNLDAGEFIMEYVGEVVDSRDFRKRAKEYSKDKNRHYYFMALKSDQIIDATMKGNISRFINHSCDPNAETQKWTVSGELRIGFFTKKFVAAGEEITFDYHFQRYGKEAQKCFCEAINCRGWIGDNPEDGKTNVERMEDSGGDESDTEDESDGDEEEEEQQKEQQQQPQQQQQREKPVKAGGSRRRRWRKTMRDDNKLVNHMEDEDLEEQIERLCSSGLKNRVHTLTLSRLMVRCRELQHRRRLLGVIQSGEQPCRRLFLDYHGLRLMWSYMMDVAEVDSEEARQFRLEIIKTLTTLPIPNRTMLIDSKVLSVVEKWSQQQQLCRLSPSGDSPEDEQQQQQQQQQPKPAGEIVASSNSGGSEEAEAKREDAMAKLAGSLLESWSNLKEVFRIPKKERLEQMKEHEREADRGYKEDATAAAVPLAAESKDVYKGSRRRGRESPAAEPKRPLDEQRSNLVQVPRMNKYKRRQLFALKVAKEAEERQRRQQEELWQRHQAQCLALGIDPFATAAMDPQSGYPLFFEPPLAHWHQHQQSPYPGQALSPAVTADGVLLYQQQQQQQQPPPSFEAQPPLTLQHNGAADSLEQQPPPALDLPPKWKWARDKRGRVYYYHARERVSQWLPPPPDHIGLQPDSGADSSSSGGDDDDDDDDDEDDDDVDESSGGEESVSSNDDHEQQQQQQHDLRDTLQQQREEPDDNEEQQQQPVDESAKQPKRRRDGLVQERIISPRREEDRIDHSKFKETKEKLRRQKAKSRLQQQQQLEQPEKLRKHRRGGGGKHAKQPKSFQTIHASDMSPTTERKIKDTFRLNMAHVMVHFLNPYRKNDCKQGRITNTEDFKYLARKLTHFVLAKELKHCKSVDELECNENVKHKAKDFVRKYMNKFGAVYQRDKDED